MAGGERSLKSQNAGWLWSIAVVDVAVLLAVWLSVSSQGNAEFTKLATQIGLRASLTSAAPVLVLLLTNILSADLKAVLIYWRLTDVLPSHRAFTVHAPKDSRIDMVALKKNIGAWPEAPREQSTFWFKLYKRVAADVSVLTAHRYYLLFRDLAAMSLVLAIATPIVFYVMDERLSAAATLLFAVQYLLSVVAARQQGYRLVTTVLALHSVKRIR
jgi:hypothetical protein